MISSDFWLRTHPVNHCSPSIHEIGSCHMNVAHRTLPLPRSIHGENCDATLKKLVSVESNRHFFKRIHPSNGKDTGHKFLCPLAWEVQIARQRPFPKGDLDAPDLMVGQT